MAEPEHTPIEENDRYNNEESSATLNKSIDQHYEGLATPGMLSTEMQIEKASEAYKGYAVLEDKPSQGEIITWYIYEFCSYFINTVLLPIVFPLLTSQTLLPPIQQLHGYTMNDRGIMCESKELSLYQSLTKRSIGTGSWPLSPLDWTSISWGIGLAVAIPLLAFVSILLDHRPRHQLITIAAIVAGGIFCLPVGFFKTEWVFPVYITAIVAGNTLAASSHNRHFGLMLRGFLGPNFPKTQFGLRKGISSWLSLLSTAAGSLGAAVISSFAFYMLHHYEKFLSLWIVSIFSGLKWLAGVSHVVVSTRNGDIIPTENLSRTEHNLAIFSFPHALSSLVAVFLSSFSTMSIFTGVLLYLVGEICISPKHVLFFWLTYFSFPLLSLPLLHPLQQLIKADAARMQVLGFFLSALTSGVCFYFKGADWTSNQALLFAAIQSTSVGLLHAFGKVLLLDSSPYGKEGVFSMWHSWLNGLGLCSGFAFASWGPGNVGRSVGVAFVTSVLGILVLVMGNVSSFGGAVQAGHVREIGDEKGSPEHGVETISAVLKMDMETP